MPVIDWEGRQVELAAGESVLDGLLRIGADVAHSCRAGVCQTCLLKASSGQPGMASQAGLKAAWIEQSCFLACVCYPAGDLVVETPGAGVRSTAKLISINWLSPTVLRVILQSEAPPVHRAGQYLTLFREDGLARSYSIASLPGEGEIELHVRIVLNGRMSSWLAQSASPGITVGIQGPAGNCFYTAGAPDQPLLMAATGTGLAPLYGIVRDALEQGHCGPIWLYHGAVNSEGLYLQAELEALAAKHSNLRYWPVLRDLDGSITDFIISAHPQLKGWRGFICGNPDFVSSLKKRVFLSGMASREIHSDAFVSSPPSS
jgi:CDP-4-dehydro-6-deoxyglucose reductase